MIDANYIIPMRIPYRASQLINSLQASLTVDEISQVRQMLPPKLLRLYLEMHPSEQVHSLRIFQQLRASGEENQDLLTASLLHDVGKNCYSLSLLERIVIVIVQTIFPHKARKWGTGKPYGWKRPFVVAQNHPVWGADMAAEAGASPLTVNLIRRHQEKGSDLDHSKTSVLEDRLLESLQYFDNNN